MRRKRHTPAPSSTGKLAECPFCGNSGVSMEERGRGQFMPTCRVCTARMGSFATRELAESAWNNRRFATNAGIPASSETDVPALLFEFCDIPIPAEEVHIVEPIEPPGNPDEFMGTILFGVPHPEQSYDSTLPIITESVDVGF